MILSYEEKKELQELINLLYNGHISQYGKRKLEVYIKKQQKERKAYIKGTNDADELCNKKWQDKIKAKIEEINKEMLNEENSLELFYRKKYCKEVLQSLLEKE